MLHNLDRDKMLVVVNTVNYSIRCATRRPHPREGLVQRLTYPARISAERTERKLQHGRRYGLR